MYKTKGDSANLVPPEGSCGFFLNKKRRFCKFKPNAGHKYCAEHACAMGVQLERKRIQCPLDPKHTCYEDSLEKHLKKCNGNLKKKNVEYYHEEGINAGSNSGDEIPEPKATVCNVSDEQLQQMIDKVNKLYEEHIGSIESDILSHNCLREELENPTYGTPALRHRKQQASLIGHLGKLSLLKDGLCYVELGAGKGESMKSQLSHWVQKAVEDCYDVAFVLVDRGNIRYKLDSQHKDDGPAFERLRIDIEHLNLGKFLTISGNKRPIVAMGKHLCGSATDLALRCLLETTEHIEQDTTNESGESPSKKSKTDTESFHRIPAGVVVALCCHHRCTWKAYVGKDFMKQCGFSARDFQLLSSMSSWATCTWKGWRVTGIKANEGEKPDDNDKSDGKCDLPAEEHDLGETEMMNREGSEVKLTEKEREEVGRRSKRLIDIGRVKYLLKYNMSSYLREYIDHHLTPENVVLIAKPGKTSS